jgi:hypothetical protein
MLRSACAKLAALKTQNIRRYFSFFFVSGFCSVLCEVVWLRLATAKFGVTTAMVSIALSTFMGGLGLGSWASGYLTRRYGSQIKFPALPEVPIASVIQDDPNAPALADDRPINEYFLIRKLREPVYLEKISNRLLGRGRPS